MHQPQKPQNPLTGLFKLTHEILKMMQEEDFNKDDCNARENSGITPGMYRDGLYSDDRDSTLMPNRYTEGDMTMLTSFR